MTTPRPRIALAAAIATVAAASACTSKALLTPASSLPKEALPSTFAPLRWSVRADDVPALFPNSQATRESSGAPVRHVTWTVPDIRRIEGVAGTLVATWVEGGDLRSARLTFRDPRRECDPDLPDRPRPCAEAGPALSRIWDTLRGELARGRGGPESSAGAHGARTATWRGPESSLAVAMGQGPAGAWSVEASVARVERP